ncbi:MAG: hypothetical protein H0W02_14275 [Ktedonobacteraceae bacterium]|nr:hypothetical protein [Ktedonobacteraceae bacterium]
MEDRYIIDEFTVVRELGQFLFRYHITPRMDNFTQESATFTPGGLLAFGNWIEQHRGELEAEIETDRQAWEKDAKDMQHRRDM